MADLHPHSAGHNFVDQFPEIFKKYEVLRFQFAKSDRLSDFLSSSSFLFGSHGNRDVGMIFSAVQRASQPNHTTFEAYIQKQRRRLLGIWWDSALKKRLEQIAEEYHNQFGMRRSILRFYLDFLSPEDKKLLQSRIFLPPQLVKGDPQESDSQIKSRLDLLLGFRHELAHAASYTAFSDGEKLMPHKKGEHTWFMKLSFEEFYEITRKALAKFWLSEYETYLTKGGKEEVDHRVERILREIEQLNAEAETKKADSETSAHLSETR